MSGIDRDKGLVVIRPSGVDYETMTSEDMVVVDLNGQVVEGQVINRRQIRRPILVLYNKYPQMGGIVHTHSTWAVTFAAGGELPIPAPGTTHADYFYGDVPCTRDLTAEEIDEAYEVKYR